MNSNLVLKNIGRFLLLALLQVLVFNNVYLGGYITPCLYLLFLAMLPTNTGKIATLLIAFFTGLTIDVSTGMLGLHTAACTLVGFLRPIWLDKIIMRDNEEAIEQPSLFSCPYQQFALYLLFLLLIFYFVYYLLLVFDLHALPTILISTILSTLITWLLAVLYQTLFTRKHPKP